MGFAGQTSEIFTNCGLKGKIACPDWVECLPSPAKSRRSLSTVAQK